MTFGTSIPTGAFLSAILVGSSIGFIYEILRLYIFKITTGEISSLPIIIGATSMVSGYTRLTYSIVLLMLEASDSFDLAVPMILAVWISNITSNFISTSLFARELRNK